MKRVPILVGAAIIAVALVPWFLWWSSLPDPVASHFDFRGHADGHLAPIVLMIALGGVAAVLAVSAALSAREVTALPRLASGAPILAFVASVLAVTSLASVVANRDATSWESARLSVVWLGIAMMFGVGAALAIAAVQPTPDADNRARDASHETVGFGPTERVAWVGRSSSRLFVVIAAVLAVTGIVQIFTVSPPVGGIVLLSAVAVAAFFSVHVVISGAGVRVRGLLAWPRVTIPLDRIAAAESIDVRPLAWGGWGYRGSLRLMRRAAWVVHGGPGLKLELRDGKVFVVTVDGAEEAAAVVNGLIAT